jgi:hypothetical protein
MIMGMTLIQKALHRVPQFLVCNSFPFLLLEWEGSGVGHLSFIQIASGWVKFEQRRMRERDVKRVVASRKISLFSYTIFLV